MHRMKGDWKFWIFGNELLLPVRPKVLVGKETYAAGRDGYGVALVLSYWEQTTDGLCYGGTRKDIPSE